MNLEVFEKNPTNTTPYVRFDPSEGSLVLRGDSYPENVSDFYGPIVNYLRECLPKATSLEVDFHMSYFNTSSAKYFFDLLSLLEEWRDRVHIHVRWHYLEGDELMLEHGVDFRDDLLLPIELVCEENVRG